MPTTIPEMLINRINIGFNKKYKDFQESKVYHILQIQPTTFNLDSARQQLNATMKLLTF
jgi:hypothetical protein